MINKHIIFEKQMWSKLSNQIIEIHVIKVKSSNSKLIAIYNCFTGNHAEYVYILNVLKSNCLSNWVLLRSIIFLIA